MDSPPDFGWTMDSPWIARRNLAGPLLIARGVAGWFWIASIPNAHGRVSNLTPKAEFQEPGELHTTARLDRNAPYLGAIRGEHVRAAARSIGAALIEVVPVLEADRCSRDEGNSAMG